MKLVERREFLKASIPALFFTSFFINQSPKAELKQAPLPQLPLAVVYELKEIYLSWKNKYHQEPDEFFAELGEGNKSSMYKISQMTRIDFAQGNTIEVHGLVLAKTEAAFYASLYVDTKVSGSIA